MRLHTPTFLLRTRLGVLLIGAVLGTALLLLRDADDPPTPAVQDAALSNLEISPENLMRSFLERRGDAAPASLSASDCLGAYHEGATMIDVRTPGEFARGHLACAINVDILAGGFEDRIAALGLDPEKPVYLYCRSGNRSGRAAKILRGMGFAEAYNVGGFEALRDVGFETN